jgi:hypothetical protein
MATPSAGPNISPVPAPVQQTLSSSYLDFSTGWAQQYLPELYEAEVERYGNRMLSGLLAKVGAEEAMASDQVVWSEQGRLHISIPDVTTDASEDMLIFDDAAEANLVRKFDTVLLTVTAVSGGSGATQAVVGDQIKCIVTAVDVDSVSGGSNDLLGCTVKPYTQASLTSTATGDITCNDNTQFTLLIYGSEHSKGTSLDRDALTPSFKSFTNKPIIIRDRYQVSGSDAAQIGWVEVTGEEGQSGYLWYLKAEGDTRARFNDYLEMSMLEAVEKVDGANAAVPGGTEGMFAAIEDRGHVVNDTFVASSVNSMFADNMGTIDNILTTLDGQGAIEENMLYLNRTQNINLDDTLGNIGAGYAAAAGFGMFDNSADMALNLGFSGFRRGSYDFYKTDWKYLNDNQMYGGIAASAKNNKIEGALIPAGVSSVYDETMGKNMKRPFLHVRYRASQSENRKLKTWITGSVGGNITSDLDAMQVNYLSERCLVVQAANNFMLLKG